MKPFFLILTLLLVSGKVFSQHTKHGKLPYNIVTKAENGSLWEKYLSIYPSPYPGQLIIQYRLSEGITGKVQIVDSQGTLIKDIQLHPMLSFLRLDLGNVASGTYFYRFLINNIQKASGKIIVIK